MTNLIDQENSQQKMRSGRPRPRWLVPVLAVAVLVVGAAGIALSQAGPQPFWNRVAMHFTPTPTRTPKPPATATATPTNSPMPTATATATPTNSPTPTFTFTPLPTDTSTPIPTDTPTPTPTDTPTPTPTDTPVPTFTPTAAPTTAPARSLGQSSPPSTAAAGQKVRVLVAPEIYADVIGGLVAGESVSVLARAPIDDWLFIRTSGGLEGFVQQTYLHWSGDFQSLSIRQPPPGWAISTGENEFVLEYPGCIPHASDWGVVKGQVLNQDGSPIVGARVEMWLNGARWDDKANPATTNEDGWYEWIIAEGQAVRLSALYIDGRRVGFAPTDLIVITKGGCFHNLNFVKQ